MLIIAAGPIKNHKRIKKFLKNIDYVICADGGANHLKKLGISADLIIGDFDSFNLKNRGTVDCKIFSKAKDETDGELALKLSEKLNPKEIIIVGALGGRLDHTLENLRLTLKSKFPIKLISDFEVIETINKSTIIHGKKGDVISLIPTSKINKISSSGLKYPLSDKWFSSGKYSISNKLTGSTATIRLKEGKLLLIRSS